MHWIKVTSDDNSRTKVRIQIEHIESYHKDSGSSTYVNLVSTSYHQVKETPEQIDKMIEAALGVTPKEP